MNKTEWVEKTAEITNTHKSVALNVLTTGLTLIKKELSTGNRVYLSDFGSFVVTETNKTTESLSKNNTLPCPEKEVIFRQSKSLKNCINSKDQKDINRL